MVEDIQDKLLLLIGTKQDQRFNFKSKKMDETFVKLYRKFIYWEWFHDDKMVKLFIYLLVMASYKKNKYLGYDLERGQLITGRKRISKDTGLQPRSIRTCLNKLILTNEITVKSSNKHSLITLCNYDLYQSVESKTTSKTSDKVSEISPISVTQPTTLNKVNNIIKDIIVYLNEKTNSSYRFDSKKTNEHIGARLKEGFTLDDFKKVIDVKSKEWLHNEKMLPYLRPQTLFSGNFEGYLNQCKDKPKTITPVSRSDYFTEVDG